MVTEGVRAFRAELLSVPEDPMQGGAIRHHRDGLMVVEHGIVVAFGDHDDLAPRFPGVPVERLAGLVVPGFVDTHIHYPQTDRIAAYGGQLLEWVWRRPTRCRIIHRPKTWSRCMRRQTGFRKCP